MPTLMGSPLLKLRLIRLAPPHPIMPIDSFTVLLFGLFIKLLLGVLFLVFWLKTRARRGLPGGAVAAARRGSPRCCSCGAAPDGLPTSASATPSLLAALACCWQGARAFDSGRRPPFRPGLSRCSGSACCPVPDFLPTIAAPARRSRSCLIAALLRDGGSKLARPRRAAAVALAAVALLATFALFLPSGSRCSMYCRFRSVRCQRSLAGSAPSIC